MKFVCCFGDCSREFTTRSGLAGHVNLHLKNNSYACDICDGSYPSLKRLRAHQITHREPKYKCDQCGGKFFTNQNLKRHRITCNLEYICGVCGRGFVREANYAAHVDKKHPPQAGVKYLCPLCYKLFGSKHSLRDHHSIRHENRRFGCACCGREFSYKSSLNAHTQKGHTQEQ